MINNYVSIALRILRRHPVHMGLTLLGLATGLASFFIIGGYVQSELRFDRFHEKADRIWRVGLRVPASPDSRWAASLYPHADLLAAEMPEVESAIRLQDAGTPIIASDRLSDYEERVLYVDEGFFHVFDFEVLAGDPSALAMPNTVFMTPQAAEKYFGEADPIGRVLTLDNESELEVAGLVAPAPYASHIQFDFLASLRTNEAANAPDPWRRLAYTYVLLRDDADYTSLQARLAAFSEFHVAPHLDSDATVDMIPLTRIHLFGNFRSTIHPQGDYRIVLLFSAVAFLVLLIACVNYVTLVTARSAERAREVGIRKCLGATRRNLVEQFYGEATVFASTALVLAIAVTAVMYPSIAAMIDRRLPVPLDASSVLFVSTTFVGIILFCGGYPALVLSRFAPASIFRGIVLPAKRPRVRRSLLVFQFAVSVALIATSLVIARQLSYLQEKPLGFDRENVLVIETHGGLAEGAGAFKQEMLRLSGVDQVSIAYAAPARPFAMAALGSETVEDAKISDADRLLADLVWADLDYVETLGLEVVSGRAFSGEMPTDAEGVLINEAAVKAFGWSDPIGKKVRDSPVIGVVRDFHTKSLHDPIRPTLIHLDPSAGDLVLVRLGSGSTSETVRQISRTWSSFVPSIPFDFAFLDQDFDAMYRSERRIGGVFMLFTSLAVFLACLGLFGVTSFVVQQRTKEIGIRKILGASSFAVFRLLSREFVAVVALAIAFGAPVAYFGTSRWLEGFAYRAHVGPDLFLLAGAVAMALALLVAGSHSWRVARINPATSLRYE